MKGNSIFLFNFFIVKMKTMLNSDRVIKPEYKILIYFNSNNY